MDIEIIADWDQVKQVLVMIEAKNDAQLRRYPGDVKYWRVNPPER